MDPADTRTSLLQASYALMLNKGYAATGVAEICRSARVSKGAFYHCFQTKQHCALEMLRHQMTTAQAIMEQGLHLDGPDDIKGSLRYVRHVENRSEQIFRDGCLIGSFALELAETHPELREQVSRIFQGTTGQFARALAPLARARKQPPRLSPRDLAEHMLTVIEGGVVLARAHGDTRFVSQGLRLFRRSLEIMYDPKEKIQRR